MVEASSPLRHKYPFFGPAPGWGLLAVDQIPLQVVTFLATSAFKLLRVGSIGFSSVLFMPPVYQDRTTCEVLPGEACFHRSKPCRPPPPPNCGGCPALPLEPCDCPCRA